MEDINVKVATETLHLRANQQLLRDWAHRRHYTQKLDARELDAERETIVNNVTAVANRLDALLKEKDVIDYLYETAMQSALCCVDHDGVFEIAHAGD
jgi:hypothetical protein